jgi:CYTH domain-containing protein
VHVTIRVICPRCGRPGTLYLRIQGNRAYLTVVHGDSNTEHSLGPIEILLRNREQLLKQLLEAYRTYLMQELAKLQQEALRRCVAKILS